MSQSCYYHFMINLESSYDQLMIILQSFDLHGCPACVPCSTVIEYSIQNPKVEGSNLAQDTGRETMAV